MAFLKLDCGILHSTVWVDRDARDIFITSLLLAEPHELREPAEQIEIRTLNRTGWIVPVGWYGFVRAASLGIIDRAGVEREAGLDVLERFGSPEPESRSQAFEGRRLVRIDGGFLALNYDRYRSRDTTSAERSRRFREREKERADRRATPLRHGRTPLGTQAEAEAEGEIRERRGDPKGASPPDPSPPDKPADPAAGKKARKTAAARVTAMPDGWRPDETAATMARDLGLDPRAEFADFRDWTTAKRATYADWQAAFRSHLRRRGNGRSAAARPDERREIVPILPLRPDERLAPMAPCGIDERRRILAEAAAKMKADDQAAMRAKLDLP